MSTIDDFKRLHREYQFLEQNRKDYAKDSAHTIARQQKLIDKLKKDNEFLKNEYRNHLKKPRAASSQSKLIALQDQVDVFTQKISLERRNNDELRKQSNLMRRKILNIRKAMGGVNAARENQAMINKQIRILENRLDKALVKFNEALAHNKKLRETIDNLRRERVVFDNIYRKLERELHDKKKQMASIIELSNQAYEARDKAQMEIAAIEKDNMKQQKQHEQQMEEYERALDQDGNGGGGGGPGGAAGPGVEVDEDGTVRGALTIDEEKQLKHNVTKAAWVVVKEKANIHVSKEKVQSYEQAFDQIKASTGITDIEELVKTFIANEDQNFSLFNYVNGQTHEIEKLEEIIEDLKDEERKYAQETGDESSQHKQLQRDLQQRLDGTNNAAEKYEGRFQEAQKTIMSLKIGIQNIFTKIECDAGAMSEMLAGEAVTEANMMQYLGMIEQRTNEILQMWAMCQHKPGHPDRERGGEKQSVGQAVASILGQGPMTPMGEQKIAIAPPTMEEYSDVDQDDSDTDEMQMPHNLDQIKTEVMRYMSQKTISRGMERKRGGSSAGGGRGPGGGRSRGGGPAYKL